MSKNNKNNYTTKEISSKFWWNKVHTWLQVIIWKFWPLPLDALNEFWDCEVDDPLKNIPETMIRRDSHKFTVCLLLRAFLVLSFHMYATSTSSLGYSWILHELLWSRETRYLSFYPARLSHLPRGQTFLSRGGHNFWYIIKSLFWWIHEIMYNTIW